MTRYKVDYDEALRVTHQLVNLLSPTSKEQKAFGALRVKLGKEGESPKNIIKAMLSWTVSGLSFSDWPEEKSIK